MKHPLFLFSILSLFPLMLNAQTASIPGKCGDTLESEFKNSQETQTIEISMSAGDQFEIMVVPVSDELKIRAEMYAIRTIKF